MGEPESQAGRVLGGRFRLEYQLGEGGFGTIWRAEQLVLGATVAVKLIDLAIARQAGALERFLREAQAAATLRSPHVVQILDYGVEGDQPFIAMELLEGETLAERLHRVGRLAPSEALRIVTHIARAMSRAHECSIVHRDLKPENVFLVRNEDDEVAKVLDFGVAKMKSPILVDESTQTRTGSLIGTPHYMSPEQVQGNKTVDYRSDIWALGVIAFEMFTGQRPFTGNALGDLVLQICVRDMPKPSQLAPVPAGFDEWFAKAAERDQEKRFQSARELAQSLREVVGGNETALIVADEIDESRSNDIVSTSSIVPNHPNRTAAVAGASLELADTIFSPLDATPHGRSSAPIITLSRGVAVVVLGAVVALGVWYSNAKKVGHFRTSFVAASASASSLAAGSVNIGQAESAPAASVRTPISTSRSPGIVREKNSAVVRRAASSSQATNLPASDATKPQDASTKAPSLAVSNVENPTAPPVAASIHVPDSPGSTE